MIPCRAIVPALLTRMLQPAERGQRRRDDLLPALLACDVLHPEQRLAALLRQPFREALADSRIDIGKDDCGAFAHEQFGFRRPLPSRGSISATLSDSLGIVFLPSICCRCDGRSDEAIPDPLRLNRRGIASLRSQ
jgi:hypothetical protein